jgi:hypothetical protein
MCILTQYTVSPTYIQFLCRSSDYGANGANVIIFNLQGIEKGKSLNSCKSWCVMYTTYTIHSFPHLHPVLMPEFRLCGWEGWGDKRFIHLKVLLPSSYITIITNSITRGTGRRGRHGMGFQSAFFLTIIYTNIFVLLFSEMYSYKTLLILI